MFGGLLLFCSGNVHQAVTAVEIEAEQVVAVAQIQGLGFLARFAAAHSIGITYAMVRGHQMFRNGVGVACNLVIVCRVHSHYVIVSASMDFYSCCRAIVPMAFNQFRLQLCHQSPFQFAQRRGGDESRLSS